MKNWSFAGWLGSGWAVVRVGWARGACAPEISGGRLVEPNFCFTGSER